jgi:hypothetical protein
MTLIAPHIEAFLREHLSHHRGLPIRLVANHAAG